jgi:predicted enzyme related to lactoylglutathione lyase
MSGKIVHFEIAAKDAGRARKFYGELFGWEFKDAGFPGMDYHLTGAGGKPEGAVFKAPDQVGSPLVYWDTADIDLTIRSVRTLGGTAEEKPRATRSSSIRTTAR